MTSPPDKFFRDHLGPYQKPAPGRVWDRIESGQAQRRLRWMWMKAAAAITLLLATTYLLWPVNDITQEAEVAQAGTPESAPLMDTVSIHVQHEVPVNTDHPIPSTSSMHKPRARVSAHPVTSNFITNTAAPEPAAEAGIMSMAVVVIENTIPDGEIAGVEEAVPVDVTERTASPELRTTLVYSVQEVNSRFLKESMQADATPNLKSTSGLKKVIDIAADIKYDDNPIGDLRQKKNEILSLGFLDRKTEADQ